MFSAVVDCAEVAKAAPLVTIMLAAAITALAAILKVLIIFAPNLKVVPVLGCPDENKKSRLCLNGF